MISEGTEGFPRSCPPIGEKSRAFLSPTKQDRVFLWVLTTTAWAEFHSLTPLFFLPFNWQCEAISTPMETETPPPMGTPANAV